MTAFGCDDDDPPPCWNGQCFCPPGESCQLPCLAPPCHIECARDNPSCVGQCGNGECHCGPRSLCRFTCQSPPCHVSCDSATDCAGTCANGTCRCETGSSCEFDCAAGPCHVECAGQHPSCDGECATAAATADEQRLPLHLHRRQLSRQLLAGLELRARCPKGRAGEQGCRFETCAAGMPVVCAGGQATACGASCP